MTNRLRTRALVAVIFLASGISGRAQDQSAPKVGSITTLRVQVVISKYQGDKKISSLPYTLTVNSERGSRASLRMGAQVPVVTGSAPTPAAADGRSGTPVQSIQYKDVGTNIDCVASPIDSDGRYKLDISIEDSSVYTQEGQNAMRPGDHPSFRSYRSSNTLLLKDGQTTQFTTATDKVNGEVVKADVTLNVVK